MLVFLVVYQQLENHVLQPLVYSRTVQLSPLAILIAVLIGAKIAGILGALARFRSQGRSRSCCSPGSAPGANAARARLPPSRSRNDPSWVSPCRRGGPMSRGCAQGSGTGGCLLALAPPSRSDGAQALAVSQRTRYPHSDGRARKLGRRADERRCAGLAGFARFAIEPAPPHGGGLSHSKTWANAGSSGTTRSRARRSGAGSSASIPRRARLLAGRREPPLGQSTRDRARSRSASGCRARPTARTSCRASGVKSGSAQSFFWLGSRRVRRPAGHDRDRRFFGLPRRELHVLPLDGRGK